MSPYWGDELAALGALVPRLAPKKLAILTDRNTELFRAEAASTLTGAKIFDLSAFGKSRLIHAKVIIAETNQADNVLYGSANCMAAPTVRPWPLAPATIPERTMRRDPFEQ
ncbi:hypothetical protein [Aestuariivirga sp.]|uniref:hypothetical protein n=1 Tax=Aestuariivirga sp. TaxID=2650926 RepID=UPI003BAC942A